MGCFANIIYGIVQFVAFVLIVVGTPLDMFRARKEGEGNSSAAVTDYIGNNFCMTMWGLKKKCYTTSYMEGGRANEVFASCRGRVERFKAAQTCAIIALAAFGIATLFGFLQNCYSGCLKWLCVILNAVGVIAAIVAWACMLDCWNRAMGTDNETMILNRPDQCVALKNYGGFSSTELLPNGTMLGAGFILLVVGTALGFVNTFIILIPC